MGPFKTSNRGNTWIVLAVDHFNKFAEGAATTSFDAETTASFLFNQVICRHGMIEGLLSDQGVNFEARLFKNLLSLLGIEKKRTSSTASATLVRLVQRRKPSTKSPTTLASVQTARSCSLANAVLPPIAGAALSAKQQLVRRFINRSSFY